MVHKFNLILSLCSILLLCTTLFAQESSQTQFPENRYTLNELYKIALKRAEKIKISENNLFIAEKDKDRAFAVLVPTFTAFGDYTRYSKSSILQPESTRTWGISLEQTFTLNGKELLGLSMAEDRIIQNSYDLLSVKELYLFTVASAYYNVLKATRALEIADASVKRLETHKSAVITLQQLEEVPKTALFRAQAELSGSITKQVYAKNNLRLTRTKLATLVDLPSDFELALPDLKENTLPDCQLDTIKQEALLHRTDFLSTSIDKNISDLQVKYSKSSYWPTLTLGGGYTEIKIESPEISFFSPETKSLYGHIMLNVPLFDGGLRGAELEQALARKRQVRLVIKEQKKQIEVEVEEAYLNLNTAKQTLESIKDQLKSARENYAAVSQQFKYGLSNSLDVMDANTLLVQAETELADAQYNLKLAVLNLKQAEGSFLKSILPQIHEGTKNEGEL